MTTTESQTCSSITDFVNGLIHSFSESDSEDGGGDPSSAGDTADFENLMHLTETDRDSGRKW